MIGVSCRLINGKWTSQKFVKAITAHEGIDGYREKAMRIMSVEAVEWSSIVELSVSGHAVRWAIQSKPSGGTSLSIAHGWNLKSGGPSTVARHLREMIKPSLLVVTTIKSEERCIYSAVLVDIIEDHLQEQVLVVLVWNEESAQFGKTRL